MHMLLVKKSFQSAACWSLFAILAVAVVPAVYAEEAKTEENPSAGPYVLERVENVDLSNSEIVAHSAAFIAEKFVSAKSVIQLKDPELGKIIGDVVLMNSKARFLDSFKGIKSRLVLDAKDGKYRLQMSNIEAIDGNGVLSPFGKLEGANRYRIEPMAKSVLAEFSDELTAYLKKAKASANW
jgi:hypothetical protein